MGLILNIDTATEIAHVSISKDGIVLQDAFNNEQKDHAAFVQPAIKKIMQQAGISLAEIDAVAVVAGPGSYTGLRVGMASAKGICYALNKPLIAIGTLECMTMIAILKSGNDPQKEKKIFCPMIDARRMEVFTALYDHSLNTILNPCTLVLDNTTFDNYLDKFSILFFGNGSGKWKELCTHYHADFQDVSINSSAISLLSFDKFCSKDGGFVDIAYAEPFYIKEFYDPKR
jgi:tRNA threonylcarbamoyladenosine biosynthesis protein TsaB